RIAIVLAHKQHGQLPERCDVDRFVEDAGSGGTIAEKHHADCACSVDLSRPGGSGRKRQVASYNSRGSEHTMLDIDDMHGSTAPPTQPGLSAQDLRKGCLDIAPFRQHVPMASMTGKKRVSSGQVCAYSDGHSFLARRQVRKSW